MKKVKQDFNIKANQELARILNDPVMSGMEIAGHDLTFELSTETDAGGQYNQWLIALDGQVMGAVYVPHSVEDSRGVMFDLLGLPVRMARDELTRLNNYVNLMILIGNRLGILDQADPTNNPALVVVTKDQLEEAGIL